VAVLVPVTAIILAVIVAVTPIVMPVRPPFFDLVE
jgi:hypothetical protein